MNSRFLITLTALSATVTISAHAQNFGFSFGRSGNVSVGGRGGVAISSPSGFRGISISNGKVRHHRGTRSGIVIGIPSQPSSSIAPAPQPSPPLCSTASDHVVLTEESIHVRVPGVEVQLGGDTERELLVIQDAVRKRQLDLAQMKIDPLAAAYPEHPAVQQAASIVAFARADYVNGAATAYQSVGFGGPWQWKDVRPYYQNNAQYLEDLKVAQQEAVADPSQKDVRFLVSVHYVMLGSFDQARRSLDKAQVLMPEDPVVAYLQESLPPASPLAER